MPNGSGGGSSRKGQDDRGTKEESSSKNRRSESSDDREEASSNDESGDGGGDGRDSKGEEKRSSFPGGKDFLFRRRVAIPEEVAQMAKDLKKMDQICTGVAVRSAMLLDAVVKLLPSGSHEHEKGCRFFTPTSCRVRVVVQPQLAPQLLVSRS